MPFPSFFSFSLFLVFLCYFTPFFAPPFYHVHAISDSSTLTSLWYPSTTACQMNSAIPGGFHPPGSFVDSPLTQHNFVYKRLLYTLTGDLCVLRYRNTASTQWCLGINSANPKGLIVLVNQTNTFVSIGLQMIDSFNQTYYQVEVGRSRHITYLDNLNDNYTNILGVVQILASSSLYFTIVQNECREQTTYNKLVWRCSTRNQLMHGGCSLQDPMPAICPMYGADTAYDGDLCCINECCEHPVQCTITYVVTAILCFCCCSCCIFCGCCKNKVRYHRVEEHDEESDSAGQRSRGRDRGHTERDRADSLFGRWMVSLFCRICRTGYTGWWSRTSSIQDEGSIQHATPFIPSDENGLIVATAVITTVRDTPAIACDYVELMPVSNEIDDESTAAVPSSTVVTLVI